MLPDLDEAMKILNAHDVSAGHQMLADGGILVWLGDREGRKAETTLPPESVGSAGAWLMQAARRVYPDEFPDSPPPK